MTEATIVPYLSIIPDRHPKRKLHDNIGLAKKAVLYRLRGEELSVPCQVYEWKADTWKSLWNIEAGTKREEMPWHASS